MGKSPAFQFYTGDWMKDTNLRICSPAARGVLADLLCLMWESEKRGVLRANSRAISIKKLSKSIAGCTPKLIKELVDNRVVRIARKDGALYSKRQVRDELKRRHKSQNGQKGGKQNPSKPPSKSKAKRGSSSSSSSSSSIKKETTTTRVVVVDDSDGVPFAQSRPDSGQHWFVGHIGRLIARIRESGTAIPHLDTDALEEMARKTPDDDLQQVDTAVVRSAWDAYWEAAKKRAKSGKRAHWKVDWYLVPALNDKLSGLSQVKPGNHLAEREAAEKAKRKAEDEAQKRAALETGRQVKAFRELPQAEQAKWKSKVNEGTSFKASGENLERMAAAASRFQDGVVLDLGDTDARRK